MKKFIFLLIFVFIILIFVWFFMKGNYIKNEKVLSQPVSGLQLSWQLPQGSYKRGERLLVNLCFKNISSNNIRLFMISNEYFRCGQSSLFLKNKKTGKVSFPQPEPRPHGYIVTEKDFPLLKPGEELTFTQTLFLDEEFMFKAGEYFVVWDYSNRIKKWLGGLDTLDGKTKHLFDDQEIPFIWLGTISVEQKIKVE